MKKIREDLIKEILDETKIKGNMIMGSIREDELNDEEFSILFREQLKMIK